MFCNAYGLLLFWGPPRRKIIQNYVYKIELRAVVLASEGPCCGSSRHGKFSFVRIIFLEVIIFQFHKWPQMIFHSPSTKSINCIVPHLREQLLIFVSQEKLKSRGSLPCHGIFNTLVSCLDLQAVQGVFWFFHPSTL